MEKMEAVKLAIGLATPQIAEQYALFMELDYLPPISIEYLPREIEGDRKVFLSVAVEIGEKGEILV